MASKSSVWRIIAVLGFIVIAGLLIIFLNQGSINTISIIQPFNHIAIDDVTNGIVDTVKAYDSTLAIVIENANKDLTTIPNIVGKLEDQGIDLYVPIFTSTSQAIKASVKNKPIVFAAVTDPVKAELLANPEHPEGNITGVSDLWPIGANLDLILRIVPTIKTIGVVYDPGDESSSVTIPILQEECKARNLNLLLKPVTSSQEIAQSLSTMIGKVDALFTANDVTVTASFTVLVSFAIDNKVPLFAGDYSSVERGAIAAVGQNYYNVGHEAGIMIIELIQGKSMDELSVKYTTGGDIYLNSLAAERMGVSISKDVLDQALNIYTTFSEE